MSVSRKEFLKYAILAGSFSVTGLPWMDQGYNTDSDSLDVHIFSKHLQFLDYSDMARAASQIGFDGVDLAVRKGGHVEPEEVRQKLPEATDAMRKAGLKTTMVTTDVDDPDNDVDRSVLKALASNGFTYYRMNWFNYPIESTMPEAIAVFQEKIRKLGEINRKLGLVGCYQNHASHRPGAAIWEVHQMLEKSDPAAMGAQYDIRHATVEGAMSWENGLRLILPRIKTIALKDYKWGFVDGRWQIINTPIGEGMVDFRRFFRIMKKNNVVVAASLHFEYPLGGVEHGRDKITLSKDKIFRAFEKDLKTIKDLWNNA